MDTTVIIALISGLFILFAALIPQFFQFLLTKQERDKDKLVIKLKKYIETTRAFYCLEELYIEELSQLNSQTPNSIKNEFRKKLRQNKEMDIDSDYSAPLATERDLKRLENK